MTGWASVRWMLEVAVMVVVWGVWGVQAAFFSMSVMFSVEEVWEEV